MADKELTPSEAYTGVTLTRIADYLQIIASVMKDNYVLAKDLATQQTEHNAEQRRILTEDLAFRREQSVKAEQEKEMFLKMMFGGAQPQPAPPGDKGQAFPPTGRARRPRHTEPA